MPETRDQNKRPLIKFQLDQEEYDVASQLAYREGVTLGTYAKSTLLKIVRAAKEQVSA